MILDKASIHATLVDDCETLLYRRLTSGQRVVLHSGESFYLTMRHYERVTDKYATLDKLQQELMDVHGINLAALRKTVAPVRAGSGEIRQELAFDFLCD